MYRALYRDFRPERFEEMIGQDHIVRILQNQIASDSASHAYLFCGTRGTGKTTAARILAKALNCRSEAERPCCECDVCQAIRDGAFIDVTEIDAASNTGVEDVREIKESVNYPPVAGRKKVFIIDEVHMLSNNAFNALLKTLEEPPSYMVFILCTTEPQKIPATILSRCLRLDFRRVPERLLIDNMKKICEARGVEAEENALALIAIQADGSVRDSLSILEQCISPGEILRRDDVAAILGTAGEEALIALTETVRKGDAAGALLQLDRMISSGIDVRLLMKEWLEHFRNLLLTKYVKNPEQVLSMSMENARRVGAQAADVSTAFLDRAVRELTDTISGTRWSPRPRVMLEMSAVKLCASQETEEAFRLRYDGAGGQSRVDAAAEAAPIAAVQSEAAPVAAVQAGAAPVAAVQSETPVFDPPIPTPDGYIEAVTAAEIWDEPSERPAETPAELSRENPERPAGGPEDGLWQAVLEEASARRGIFAGCIGRTRLTRCEGNAFYISTDQKHIESFLQNNGRKLAEELMSARMGRPMRLVIEGKEEKRKPEKNSSDLHEQVSVMEDFFGMPVEVK